MANTHAAEAPDGANAEDHAQKGNVSFQAASCLISRIGQFTHCNSENIRKKYIPRRLLKRLKKYRQKGMQKWKALNTFSVTMTTQ